MAAAVGLFSLDRATCPGQLRCLGQNLFKGLRLCRRPLFALFQSFMIELLKHGIGCSWSLGFHSVGKLRALSVANPMHCVQRACTVDAQCGNLVVTGGEAQQLETLEHQVLGYGIRRNVLTFRMKASGKPWWGYD